jgi:hypothetical protein
LPKFGALVAVGWLGDDLFDLFVLILVITAPHCWHLTYPAGIDLEQTR